MLCIWAILIIGHSVDEVLSCAATTTTTTPAPTACDDCTANDINFIMVGQGATAFTPPMGTLSTNAVGCNQLTLTCLPGPGGASTIDNGVDTNTVTYCQQIGTCVVVLTCNALGQWTFTQAAITVIVTDIRCAAT